jgi:hypothetical protein
MIEDICFQTINKSKQETTSTNTEPATPKKERKQREKKIRSDSQINRDKERMAQLRSLRTAKKTNNASES